MLITRGHLSVRFAGEDTHHTSDGVTVEPDGRTWATNGSMLVSFKATKGAWPPADFPVTPDGRAALPLPAERITLEKGGVELLARALPKKPSVPILKAASMVACELPQRTASGDFNAGRAELFTTDLSSPQTISVTLTPPVPSAGRAVELLRKKMSKRPQSTVYLNADLLETALKCVREATRNDPRAKPYVRLDLRGGTEPVTITANVTTEGEGGTLTALIMPVGGEPVELDADLVPKVKPTEPAEPAEPAV